MTDVDNFGRLLRYVYLPDGRFVNEAMVRQGFALANESPPNVSQSEPLAMAQISAQASGLGMWADDACGAPVEANLMITHVEYDAPGNDSENLNGEWVDIENVGPTVSDLTGWVVRDESSSHRYTFREAFVLDAGARVRVFTGCGPDKKGPSYTEVHWCEDGAVWNNPGDTAFLLDPKGNIHDEWGY
jgi:micrococcal nuclease